MKRVANILLLVGGIIGIVLAVTYFVTAIVYFILSSPVFAETLIEGLRNGTITTDFKGGDLAEAVVYVQAAFATVAIVFISLVPFTVASAIICFVGRKKQSMPLYIANIVFGVLGSTIVNTVAGVLGVIATAKERRDSLVQ